MLHGNETAIAQREREIEDIAQGIIELANIFQDLQAMVIDQGSMLDRIDYNVERMASDVKEADKELTVATGYQRKSIKRKIMLLLIILIFGMFILLGIRLNRKSNASSAAPASAQPPAGEITARDTGIVVLRRFVEPDRIPAIPSFRLRRDWRRRRKDVLLHF